MDMNLLVVLAIAAALLLVAGAMGAVLALGLGWLSPLPVRRPEAKEAPAEPVDEEALASRKAAYRQGLLVLVGLAVLTAIEYAIAVLLEGATAILFIVALAKAGVILQYYMHVSRLGGEEEVHG